MQTAVVPREYERLPFPETVRASCAGHCRGDREAFAATFSKAHPYGLVLSREGAQAKAMDAALVEGRHGYGAACRRDIFGAEHAFPFCLPDTRKTAALKARHTRRVVPAATPPRAPRLGPASPRGPGRRPARCACHITPHIRTGRFSKIADEALGRLPIGVRSRS